MRKILLGTNKSKESVNVDNTIPVEFSRDVSMFHDEILSETIDTMQVYNDEKDSSSKHRMIFTVYPICTNALFNNITEVVYKEGSDEATMLTNSKTFNGKIYGAVSTEKLNRIQAIRNTEYSNEKFGFTYHCGADIFNNHLLRSKDDTSIQKRHNNASKNCIVYVGDTNTSSNIDPFNTIGDFSRNYNGYDISIVMPNSSSNYTYENYLSKKTPLYMFDTINSFIDSYNDGIERKDGWMGFNNPSTIGIPIIKDNKEEYYVNKCINNKDACQFIDMSPERDLFSFTPKKNLNRDRLEYNWDYFITYPYKSVYDDGFILKGRGKGLPLIKFGEEWYREYIGSSGVPLIMFRSPVCHNLKINDNVKIKFSNGENVTCTVVKLGTVDGKFMKTYFSVRKNDFEDYINKDSKPERFAKVIQGYECEYYFRMFKKFDEIQTSTINRLAFANTIYGDDISQIVYIDDINIDGYKDNIGRPLTELYLTIIKTNRGNSLWYNNNECNNENIEYSHVFGKITSGLDMPNYAGYDLPTVRYQHNINIEKANKNKDGVEFTKSSVKIENNITKETDEFFGDLIEFSPVSLTETTIEDIIHRFNTAQRETDNSNYNTLYYDEIGGDIFDGGYYGTNKNDDTRIRQYKLHEGYANLAPEGYIYKPHYKIKIGQFEDTVNQLSDSVINTLNQSFNEGTSKKILFSTNDYYSLLNSDIVSIMDNSTFMLYQYIVDTYSYDDEQKLYICKASLKGEEKPDINADLSNFTFFKHNLAIPEYAYMIPDGTGRHLWKDLIKPSELTFMDDLYRIPFTNGAFYHHTNINFFLRRQDPFHNFGMFAKKDGIQINNNFEVPTIEYDYSGVEHIFENDSTICV